MSIRFQADADLDQTIVTALLRREPSIDWKQLLERAAQRLEEDR